MFAYKFFRSGGDTLLAIADREIVGKKFSSGSMDIEVRRDFYMEKTCSCNDALRLLDSATIVNAMGNNIVKLLLENNFIGSARILDIGGVKHAQIVRIE